MIRDKFIAALHVFLCFIFSPNLFSQFPAYPKFKHIGVEQGLPQSGVYYTYQDKKGCIWIITGDGLCKYDGYKFTVYKNDKRDSTSVKSGLLICMEEDKNGYFWLGYRLKGLSKFDPVTGKCIHFKSDPKDSTSLSHDDVRGICKDRNGNICVATGNGLNCVNPNTGAVKRYFFKAPKKGMAWDENMLWSLLPDGDKLWIGSYRQGGLHCFDINKKTFATIKHDPNNTNSLNSGYIVGIQKDKSGNLWLTTRSGLCVYNPGQNKFTRYYSEKGTQLVSDDLWGGLLLDKEGNAWVGSFANGLTHISVDKKRFTQVVNNEDVPSSLSNNAIRHIFQDASGLVWIGTINGLNIYNPRHESFQLIQNVPGVANSLAGRTVNTLLPDGKKIWIGLSGDGVDLYDKETGNITHFKHDPKDPNSLPNNYFKSISKDHDGNYYFILFSGPSVFKYNEKIKKFQNLGGFWGMTSICDDDGRVWVGTTAGLGTTDSLDKFHYDPNDSTTFAGQVPNFLTRYDKDHFWIAAGNMLSLFNIHTRKSKRYNFEDRVFGMMKDHKGNWWFSINGGLMQMDPETKKVVATIDKKNGLNNETVVAAQEDKNGHFWIATNSGLSSYDPANGEVKNYDVNDGLPNNEFNEASFNDNGILYFASMNGLLFFDPTKVQRNNYKAPMEITDLTVLNEPYHYENVAGKTPHITLDHNQYFFNVEFALLDYAVPLKNTYAYKLEGFNDDWIRIGNKHEVTFTNLNPGNYTLRIKGANNHEVWNEEGMSMNITVLPPWWKTKWFYSIVIISIIILIFTYIKWRERKLKAEKKILEDKVKERTTEVVHQKEIIEEKHKEITDSINYAQRIQRSLLASDELLKRNLRDYFVVFNPKDVVSGDFYWASELLAANSGNTNSDQEASFCLVAADSTGHGVPGAIMSMLNISCLEKSVEVEKLREPAQILNHTRKRIIETLAKDGSAEGGKDGMDCCIIVLNKNKSLLKFSAANNDLWIVRANELLEFNSDRMPVGKHDKQNIPFAQHEIQLKKGDIVYIFTDGFADQFGGADGKKFKSKKLKELLFSIRDKTMQEQAASINKVFADWKGNNEQVDDVCIIGVRITSP